MRAIRFGFENGQNHGVAFDENLGRAVAIQNAFHRLIEVQTEESGGIQAPREQNLSDGGGAANGSPYDPLIWQLVLRRGGVRKKPGLLQNAIHYVNIAGLVPP